MREPVKKSDRTWTLEPGSLDAIPSTSHGGCLTLGKFLNLSKPYFDIHKIGVIIVLSSPILMSVLKETSR